VIINCTAISLAPSAILPPSPDLAEAATAMDADIAAAIAGFLEADFGDDPELAELQRQSRVEWLEREVTELKRCGMAVG
jgi:hypothetical protein